MSFEDVLEKICRDKRTHSIPALFIVQIVAVVFDSFKLENKDEQLSVPEQ